MAEVSQSNPGIVARDLRKGSERARDALRAIPCAELLAMVKKGGELFKAAELPLGDGVQTPDDFVRQQSATTGLPEHMCRMNMGKLEYVLSHLDQVLASLTRKLDYDILTRGYGEEDGVMRSYQATTPVVGMVLPSNSPGVHSLWLPIIPLQIGLVLKPGPQEPWTPWRMAQAFFQAGIPKEAIVLYPGLGEMGAAVLNNTARSLGMASRKGTFWPLEKGPPFLSCGGRRDVAGRSGATGGHVATSAIAVARPVSRGTLGCVWRL